MTTFLAGGTFGSTNVRNNTVVIGGMVIILAVIGAVTYTINAGRPIDVELGLMSPIVLTVVAAIFGVGKIDQATQKVEDVSQKVDTVVEQTNGGLDAKFADLHQHVSQLEAKIAENGAGNGNGNTPLHSA